jgi:glycogen debranching enzyme
MVWVDACMQELLNCNILIRIARELNKLEYINSLDSEKALLEKVINDTLWDEKSGFYYDLWKNGKLNMVRHIGAYWALIAECAPVERAERMIALLSDEKAFKSPTMIASLSREHEKYSPVGSYWKGGVWAPTNYMVLKGLDKYGKYHLSHSIAMNYLSSVIEVFKKTNTFFENYAPDYIDGIPAKGEPAKKDFVGWTGLAPISILFEYVFGIKPDAAQNKIVWDINLLEEHGIKQYPFGNNGVLTLLCKERASIDETPDVIFESNIPIELEIIWGSDGNKKSIIINK